MQEQALQDVLDALNFALSLCVARVGVLTMLSVANGMTAKQSVRAIAFQSEHRDFVRDPSL